MIKDNNYSLKFVNIAVVLSLITIIYNIFEGLFSVLFGIKDESLTLFGFGIDSFVEVISGIGILHFTLKLKNNKKTFTDKFEKQALLITGISFILLFCGLVIGSIINIIQRNKPDNTISGILISVLSLSIMFFLIVSKLKIGKKLNSDAIIADAKCSIVCLYLSLILLSSSFLYQIFKISFIDIIGSLSIAVFSLKEGIETIYKFKNETFSCASCKN